MSASSRIACVGTDRSWVCVQAVTSGKQPSFSERMRAVGANGEEHLEEQFVCDAVVVAATHVPVLPADLIELGWPEREHGREASVTDTGIRARSDQSARAPNQF